MVLHINLSFAEADSLGVELPSSEIANIRKDSTNSNSLHTTFLNRIIHVSMLENELNKYKVMEWLKNIEISLSH